MIAPYLHPDSRVETQVIGDGTRVWAFTHVMAGASIGSNCNIGGHCFIESAAIVGNNVTVKNGTMLWEGVTLEDGVFVGPQVVFTNDLRPRSPRMTRARQRYCDRQWLRKTVVEEGASLGAGSVVLAGVRIGRFAMVAAGAIVTRDVPPHALVMGSPARPAGWVCECGARLHFDGATAMCRDCDLPFLKEGDLVRVATQEPSSCVSQP